VHGKNYLTVALEDGEEVKVHVARVKPYKQRDKAPEQEKSDEEIVAHKPLKVDEKAVEGKADKSVGKKTEEQFWVEPDMNQLLPRDLIGKRVRLWWPGDRCWYEGTVTARKKRMHVVKYDDGEVRAERLLGYKPGTALKWQLLLRRRLDKDRRGSDDFSF